MRDEHMANIKKVGIMNPLEAALDEKIRIISLLRGEILVYKRAFETLLKNPSFEYEGGCGCSECQNITVAMGLVDGNGVDLESHAWVVLREVEITESQRRADIAAIGTTCKGCKRLNKAVDSIVNAGTISLK